jgi:hypothetical protein
MLYGTLQSKYPEEGGSRFLLNACKLVQKHTASQARFLVEKLTFPQLADKIPQILRIPKVHYRIHNSLPLVPVKNIRLPHLFQIFQPVLMSSKILY